MHEPASLETKPRQCKVTDAEFAKPDSVSTWMKRTAQRLSLKSNMQHFGRKVTRLSFCKLVSSF